MASMVFAGSAATAADHSTFCRARKRRPPGRASTPTPRTVSPRLEHERRPDPDEAKPDEVVPARSLTEVDPRETHEHYQGDHLLNRLELGGHEAGPRAEPVCRNLEAVLEERDAPARQDHPPN